MSGSGAEDEWLRPIDLMVDSDAPDQITLELGRRHGLYLREAQRLVLDGLAPDETGLAEGIRAETRRYLRVSPWLAVPGLEPAVAAAEAATLAALSAIVTSAAATRAPEVQSSRPVRRLALQPSATIVGTMAVRKKQSEQGVELSWDAATNVVAWKLRLSTRPDPRRDYVEGELVTLPAGSISFVVTLDELPRRIQITGHARDGRVVRRAVISALTRGNSASQWKRQATAS